LIQHIVLLKWRSGTTEEQILEAIAHAEHLPSEIDGVESLSIGRNRVDQKHGYTHALIVRVADEEALDRYLQDPRRKQYIAEHLTPIEQERIEIDVPDDVSFRRAPSRDWHWGASIGMGLPPDD
jgi:hypothetical protein